MNDEEIIRAKDMTDEEIAEWSEKLRKAFDFGFMYYCGTQTGRFSSKEPNLSALPKEMVAPDFAKLEQRILASYPGLDGIGCDILTNEDVIYAKTHKAKVVQFDPQKDAVEIRFNDANLIPPTMWVPVKDVAYAFGGGIVNPNTHCPRCELPWHETPGFRFSFWDCPGCGAKREDHCSSQP